MDESLDRLADAYGIELGYVSETGEHRLATIDTKKALLAAMGVNADTEAEIRAALARAPQRQPQRTLAQAPACFVPSWLKDGRSWGITCQLYGLRSQRNHGIGDFEDLARLAEMGAQAGADFIGVNPLHALFWSDPQRCSPYSPSTRRFLNPLYIALDGVMEGEGELASPTLHLEALRAADTVDYAAVARFKRPALEKAFARADDGGDFRRFREEGGEALKCLAQFEALSEVMVERGLGAGWHAWPKQYQDCRSEAVTAFAARHAERVLFHEWLQWIAAGQLSGAQRRARAAGMRIGLYLDLAAGVAPDGMETWSDPQLVIGGARIGAPPDLFNAAGQDWGLAPMSPCVLEQRGFEPFASDVGALMRYAGAIRIDHVMGLMRLYWIPSAFDAHAGSYVRYPFSDLLVRLQALSQSFRTLVVGEDLGTVPDGFRDMMRAVEVHGSRVLYFERREDRSFANPDHYPKEALACVATHDLPTLRGWWLGRDVAARRAVGCYSAQEAALAIEGRERDRHRLLQALSASTYAALRNTADRVPEGLALAVHRYLARTPSRLLAVQLEDLLDVEDQANLPGTQWEYPNWRRRLPMNLSSVPSVPAFRALTRAVAHERPR
jgi:4-alpha-glucanotransferase